jgi:hypothetical protein
MIRALVFLAACELTPPPKAKPAPAAPAEQAAPADAEVFTPSAPIAQTCDEIGTHVAAVVVAAAKDAAEKSILEQEREAIARKMTETCTTQAWSKAQLACYAATRSPADIKACDQKYPTDAR